LNRGGGLRRKLAIGLRRRMARCGFKIAGLQPAVRAAVKRGGIAHPMPPSRLTAATVVGLPLMVTYGIHEPLS